MEKIAYINYKYKGVKTCDSKNLTSSKFLKFGTSVL
jgi:hypothetical protein